MNGQVISSRAQRAVRQAIEALENRYLLSAPLNDNRDSATVGSGVSVSWAGQSNVEATAEATDPAIAGQPAAQSVWYRWQAPVSGRVTLAYHGDFAARVGIYHQVDGALVEVNADAFCYDSYGDFDGSTGFLAVAGETYYFAVDSATAAAGTFSLTLGAVAAPANDNFADAQSLTPDQDAAVSGLAGASAEDGEPAHATVAASHSVWFKWTATTDGPLQLQLGNGGILLGVYTGGDAGLQSLMPVADNHDTYDSYGETYNTWNQNLSFNAVSGTTYYFAVDSQSAFDDTTLTLLVPPANDNFEQAQTLSPGATAFSGNLRAATSQAGEPTHSPYNSDNGGHSLWWRWTAPTAGAYCFTPTSTSALVMAAYTGSDLSTLAAVKKAASPAPLYFTAQAGKTYDIAVDAAYGQSNVGDFSVSIARFDSPSNDNFAHAAVLPAKGTVVGHLLGATLEPGEPATSNSGGGDTATVWWVWTAPAKGGYAFRGLFQNDQYGEGPDLEAYLGTSLSTVHCIGHADGSGGADSELDLEAAAGQKIYLRAHNWDGYLHDFTLSASPLTRGPGMATDVTAGGASGGSDVSWQAAPRATYYEVWRSSSAEPSGAVRLASRVVGSTSYTDKSALSGHTYRYWVRAGNPLGLGTFSLGASNAGSVAAADSFGGGVLTSAGSVTFSSNGLSPTFQTSEPKHGKSSGGSLWWNWKAPKSGQVRLQSDRDWNDGSIVTVYTGSSVSSLKKISQNGSDTAPTDSLTFSAIAGTTYRFQFVSQYGYFDWGLEQGLIKTNNTPFVVSNTMSVNENSAVGTVVGKVVAFDPEGTSLSYSLASGNSLGLFSIDSSGTIKIAKTAGLDYETRRSITLTVKATDKSSPACSTWQDITVNLKNVNEAPVSLSLSTTHITENNAPGAVVATITGVDRDAGNTLHYALVSGSGSTDNASFRISGNQLLAATTKVFHYSSKSSYAIRLRVTDAGGLQYERAFIIAIDRAPASLVQRNGDLFSSAPLVTNEVAALLSV